jgi:hypothetical protein
LTSAESSFLLTMPKQQKGAEAAASSGVPEVLLTSSLLIMRSPSGRKYFERRLRSLQFIYNVPYTNAAGRGSDSDGVEVRHYRARLEVTILGWMRRQPNENSDHQAKFHLAKAQSQVETTPALNTG